MLARSGSGRGGLERSDGSVYVPSTERPFRFIYTFTLCCFNLCVQSFSPSVTLGRVGRVEGNLPRDEATSSSES